MKKGFGRIYLLYILCAAALLASGCDNLSFHRPEKVRGTVISVDAAKKEIVIKDSASGRQRTITVKNDEQVAQLKPGMEIHARVKRGTNMAVSVSTRTAKETKQSGAKKSGEE